MEIQGIFLRAEKLNSSGRVYPVEELTKAIAAVQPRIKEGTFLGTLGQGLALEFLPEDASHKIKDVWVDDEGNARASIETLDTPRGKIVEELIKSEVDFRLSPRGTGIVDSETKQVSEYELYSIDLLEDNE